MKTNGFAHIDAIRSGLSRPYEELSFLTTSQACASSTEVNAEHADSVEQQDRTDSANLYKVLTEQVVPLFYQRDAQGVPRQWIQQIRRAMITLVPQFTTMRMVREYAERYYLASRGS